MTQHADVSLSPSGSHRPDVTHTHGARVTTPERAEHPLDPLTGEEIAAARRILDEAGHVSASTRVPRMLPVDPAKADLAAWRAGDPSTGASA